MAVTQRPAGGPMRRIAVMQPYFFPYAGYFRLLAGADQFVILDCVQFNRRGRVHRCELPGPAGAPEWLTLPLRPQARDTLIRDLAFSPDARSLFNARLERYASLAQPTQEAGRLVREHLQGPLVDVTDFLARGLELVARVLGLRTEIVRSSQLAIPREYRAQARVIEIVRALGGTEYINAPGGMHLYDARTFTDAGLRLSFLRPYQGRFPFLLPALMHTDPGAIRADILAGLETTAH